MSDPAQMVTNDPLTSPTPVADSSQDDALPPDVVAQMADMLVGQDAQAPQDTPAPTDDVSSSGSVGSDDVSSLASAVPLAIDTVPDTLNPPHPVGGSAKEMVEPGITLERPAVDVTPGMQYVETEKSAELPPEVDRYLKKVEDHQAELPQEVVIADQTGVQPTTKYLAQPVIVLPITPEVEKEGEHKSPKFSVRWLVEWSHKVMKMFAGKVIYRQVEAPAHS